MKQFFGILLLFALLTVLLPFAALLLPGNEAAPASSFVEAQVQPAEKAATGDTVSLLDEATGEVLTVPVEEYLIGAVAAELPADYQPEAFKAQAVASHSYLLACREANQAKEELKGAWLAVNTSARQGYVTQEVMRAMWGDAYEENYAKLAGALAGLAKQILTYDGKPALTCYHAISCGQTESSENVWGQPLPYLISVDSSYDLTADGYLETVTYTPQEMSDMLSVNFVGLDLSGAPAQWLGEPVRTAAGYVTELPAKGGVSINAQDFRQILGLRSCAFTIEYGDGRFIITTKGYGHGVGMSQTGANLMALTGKTYQEILAHYYPGTALSEAA